MCIRDSFWTESQRVDGKCPDCGREVHDASEEAYFFRLSKYAGRVREPVSYTHLDVYKRQAYDCTVLTAPEADKLRIEA